MRQFVFGDGCACVLHTERVPKRVRFGADFDFAALRRVLDGVFDKIRERLRRPGCVAAAAYIFRAVNGKINLFLPHGRDEAAAGAPENAIGGKLFRIEGDGLCVQPAQFEQPFHKPLQAVRLFVRTAGAVRLYIVRRLWLRP